MRSGERAVIYTGLVLAIGLGLGWRGLGSSAAANTALQAPEAAQIAVVDILTVVEKLNETPRYREALDQMRNEVQGRLGALSAELEDVQKKVSTAPKGTPEADELGKLFSTKNTELQQAYQKATADFDALATRQVGEAFKLASESAQRIAKANGYNTVIASKPVSTDFRSNNIPGALQEILARPVLAIDSAADITGLVLKDLKLDAGPTPATPAANAAPVPQAQPKQ